MSVSIRVLLAKSGLDGHDCGAKVIARVWRVAGMEAIYTRLRQTPEMINAVPREDVQVIGLSILSGARNAIVPRVRELLRAMEMNVAEVFSPGASLPKIVHFIRHSVKQAA
jgi:methylmalonyl-CoA mutase C-terminal domain/subunit